MSVTLFREARLVTLKGGGVRRGAVMSELGIIESGDVLVRDGLIAEVGSNLESPGGAVVIECGGRVLMPAFVDCHTHLCWAGGRLDEWERRLGGASYLELLASGGGIMATVRAVRAASEEELAASLRARLAWALREGTATIEIKSGYGLDPENELKMLRAIERAASDWAGTVVKTACLGHALDPECSEMVRRTIEETLPAVHHAFPGVTVDAYCEHGAWSLEECLELFERAAELGHPCRVHADQFHALGMVSAAVERGFVSVDHLEASGADELRRLGASATIGVVLPCSGFHVDGRYARGRGLIDAGGALALATNANPGSAPCVSVPMAMALGVRGCGLSAAEAIVAGTVNAAAVLGFDDRGRIEPGARADLVLLRHRDERELVHTFGGRASAMVMVGGDVVAGD